MEHEIHSNGLSNVLVILGAAGIVIPAFARLRITPVIGFILVGLLLGPMGLGAQVAHYPWLNWITISEGSEIDLIGQYGIILLLFSIGLELSFARLWKMRVQVFGLGAISLFGGGLLIALVLLAMGNSWAAAIGLGLALSLSSTALVLPIAGTKSTVGKSAFAMLLFEDLALVPIIFLLGAIAPHTSNGGLHSLFTTLWQGGLTIAIMLFMGRYLLSPLFGQAARTKSPELFLSASLLIVILSSLATSAVGLSPIVGALIGGLLIAETDYQSEVESIIAPFRGLALGVFLISIGMQIDPQYVMAHWPILLAATTGILIANTVVTTGLLRFTGARMGTALETGLLLASPSETTLILLSTASVAGLINEPAAKFWQIATAIGLTITPILARIGHDIARRIESRSVSADLMDQDEATNRSVIIGFGRVGQLIADMLDTHGIAYLAVESDIDAVMVARRHGYNVIYGDVARGETLEKLQLSSAKALILTMDEPVLVARITRRVRADLPDLTIVARARDIDHAAELYKAGASDAVPDTLESSLQLSEAVLVDLGVAMGPVIASIHEKRDEFRAFIRDQSGIAIKPKLKSI